MIEVQELTADSARFGGHFAHTSAHWQRTAGAVCAILLGLVYLFSGTWKLLLPFTAGELLEQAKVPAGLGPVGAAALGVLEVLAALLLFTPKFRRLGGIIGTGMMLFFIGWVAYFYPALAGQECKCFPLIKRTVGPGFFISDGIFLLFGVAAIVWSRPIPSFRIPTVIFLALIVLAGGSFWMGALQRSKVQVPVPVTVDGKPADLSHGKVFLFFYDPSCMHCDAAAKFMSTLSWGDTRVVAIPTVNPQWAASFLHDTHFKAETSLDLAKLRSAFQFIDPPFGVALNNGVSEETFGQAQFNAPLPAPDLKKLGFVH